MPFDIRKLEVTASTNDDAKRAAESGAAAGTVIWALQQTAGRGRQGRQWQSPAGNLYVSILLRPRETPLDYGRYSFVASLAVGDVVQNFLPGAVVELKWPNDVMANGRKISGILLEAGTGGGAPSNDGWLVAGIGLNVRHIPEKPLYPATSLAAEKGSSPPLEGVLNKLLAAFSLWHERQDREGFAPIREAWLARARKGQMRVRLPREEIQGQFAGLDENGNLRLLLEDGTERMIATGDVFF